MGRKVFLSFLGINNYKEESYYINNDKSTGLEPMRFVQEATLRHHCNHFSENDVVYVFLTSGAREKNWEDFEHVVDFCTKEKALKKGLKDSLLNMGVPYIRDIEDIGVNIKDGKSEEEIWEIFLQVYDCLNVGDEVYFDITHGFRSSPMLMLALINYAKFLKNIEVKGIYYGAFEAGNRDEKISPIWNLISFSYLQEWTIAANNFIEYGKGEGINKLLNEPIEELENVLGNFSTSRGTNLSLGLFFDELKVNLLNKSNEISIKPFDPITNRILSKIDRFTKTTEDDINRIISNTLLSVNWCSEHDLIQQGFTILQEGLVTIVLTELGRDFKDKTFRNIASSCFTIWNKDELKWKGDAKDSNDVTKEFLQNTELFKLIKPYFTKISAFRNDLNHAGYLKDAKESAKFSPKLKEYLKAVEKILSEYYNFEL